MKKIALTVPTNKMQKKKLKSIFNQNLIFTYFLVNRRIENLLQYMAMNKKLITRKSRLLILIYSSQEIFILNAEQKQQQQQFPLGFLRSVELPLAPAGRG